MKLLLVEDDREIQEMLGDYLRTEAYEVVCASNGRDACRLFDEGGIGLVLLDLMIPQVSGMDVMEHIRKKSVVPIIILSARDTEADKTLGLGMGADDYITKPFSVAEVLARVRANIRRVTQYAEPPEKSMVLTAGALRLDGKERTVTKAGERIELTAKEFDILKLLMANPKRVYTKAQLYTQVWNDAYCRDENAVSVHISRLQDRGRPTGPEVCGDSVGHRLQIGGEMMDDTVLTALLCAAVAALSGAVLYQRIVLQAQMRQSLEEMTAALGRVLDGESGEQVMVFTQDQTLTGLIAQINRLLEERQRRRAEYRRTEQAVRRMLANISHDIRTPMTVVLGYLEIMRLRKECREELLEKVEARAGEVMELMDRFFTLAKLEAGDMELERSRVDVGEVCRETVLDFYQILTRQEIRVEAEIPEGAVWGCCDREALRRILNNLISNAVRYGGDGGYLGVSLREGEDALFLEVADRGKGVAPGAGEQVFQRLVTLEDSRSSGEGSGLGLSIARELARRMGGDIDLESVPGLRTVFTVRLPKWQDERDS